ncbi:DUF86 domain-containing protein [Candidatus Woesearchaeota archaeon]|nr:DUF86 domain-containing protein [Candidatus Woesearchaeota archaeon]
MGRIEDKISEINRYLRELESILPPGFEEYQSNLEKKAACERYVEKIVEAATDLAFLAIKNRKLRMPDDDIDAFNVLLDGKIIDDGLAARLKNAKGMRNIISHQYGNIDDEIVFEAIDKELSRDIKEFVKKAGR